MQREVDINGDRCSWDEDEFVTTTHEQAQSGAITKYVDDSIDFVNLVENITYREFLQQLKALEEAQQKKSKEEERNRNIATLMEMIEQGEKIGEVKYRSGYIQSLQEAIERINNQP